MGGPVIASVPLASSNLHQCLNLWGDRSAYSPQELRTTVESVARLLDHDRAFGAVILENGVPRAFGVTAFVQEGLVQSYLSAPYLQLGKRLLLGQPSSILTVPEIAERNDGIGLQLVVLNTAYDTLATDPDGVLGALMRAFMDIHRGYRIARIVNEVFGAAAAVVQQSQSYEIAASWDEIAPGTNVRGLIGTLSREQAAARKNPLLAMFVYSPPRIGFTAAERTLLKVAITGATDERITQRLAIDIAATKARWVRIIRRVQANAPDLLANCEAVAAGPVRGPQKRHLILRYLRDHPSELTPHGRSAK